MGFERGRAGQLRFLLSRVLKVPPFIVYGLPRSRTFWLSRFLSYRDWNCGHDELRHARSMDDVKAWFSQDRTGTVETSAAPWWRLVPKEIRTIVIRRPVPDVVASLARLGFDPAAMTLIMTKLDRKLDQIERRVPGAISFRFDDLTSEAECARLFEYCLPHDHDHDWWATLAAMNLQVSMSGLIRYMVAYHPQLSGLAEIARRSILANMGPRKLVQRDDVTIQEESCAAWLRDGTRLFEEHSIRLGESPDGYKRRNWDLMDAMDRNGAMQIHTARCNGRMVGYYVCFIAPATEDVSLVSAMQISVFVTTDFSGLALRLQRAAIEALRSKGVGEVCFRAGVKADGARMGAIYRRAGAEHIGQMYRLPLKRIQ